MLLAGMHHMQQPLLLGTLRLASLQGAVTLNDRSVSGSAERRSGSVSIFTATG
jgi:hypothetical protein